MMVRGLFGQHQFYTISIKAEVILIIISMRKNFSKQFNKRPWKTPSPSSHNDLKSPRYNAIRPPLLRVETKSPIPQTQKTKPALLSFKNQLIELKQEANKASSNINSNGGSLIEDQYTGEYKNNNEVDSYNAYFSKTSEKYSNLIKNSSSSCKNIKFFKIYWIGFKTEGFEPNSAGVAHQQSNSKYEEKLKRNLQHIVKLKDSYKELEESYEKIVELKKKIQHQLQLNKMQVITLKKKLDEKKYREQTLNEQIKNLKELLDINTEELNASNFQIYKMKQQIYELTIQNKKIQHNSTKSDIRPSYTEQKPQQSIKKPCELCRTNQKLIISLSNSIQNKMLQIGKKDQAIQSLCTDLQKLQIQLKMFQKPKIVIRRIASTLEGTNQMLMVSKLRQLNRRLQLEDK